MSPRLRREVLKRIYALLVVVVLGAIAWGWMIRMPAKSFSGAAPDDDADLAPLRTELSADVKTLASEIGERNVQHYEKLRAAADFIEQSLMKAGFCPRRDGYEVDGRICENIEAEIPGSRGEIVVIGAHYDSVLGSPGA
ncbi:MAG: aminopeptidase, partial [Chthoniobacterales bacterium]|nr:aminopeptidase [Chthoniobacterales bacterium]